MSRVGILCDYCKLDRCKKCDYKCINDLSVSWQKFVRCKSFIEDDKKPLTNAEMMSALLKTDLDSAARELWFESVQNEGHTELSDFVGWLNAAN